MVGALGIVMTVNSDRTVSLSAKDWCGILASIMTILGSLFAVYIHHDRQLTLIMTRQEMVIERINRIEDKQDQIQNANFTNSPN